MAVPDDVKSYFRSLLEKLSKEQIMILAQYMKRAKKERKKKKKSKSRTAEKTQKKG